MLITLSVILAIIIIFFTCLYLIYLETFARRHKVTKGIKNFLRSRQFDSLRLRIHEHMDKLDKKEYREISTTAYDKKKLYSRLYEGSDKSTVIIQMHGYRSYATKDFCGACFCWFEKGKTVLLPDQRSHGKSDGKTISFGIRERYDVLSWIEKTTELYGKDVKIILSGISMGAATVLMASELDLPSNVKGIIADCPYSTPEKIIKKVAKDRGFPVSLTYPLIRLSALIFGGFDIENASPLDAIKKSSLPILFIHGNDDRFVPYSMGKELYDSYTGPKKLVTVENAGHAFSYFFDTELYEKELDDFTKDILTD